MFFLMSLLSFNLELSFLSESKRLGFIIKPSLFLSENSVALGFSDHKIIKSDFSIGDFEGTCHQSNIAAREGRVVYGGNFLSINI